MLVMKNHEQVVKITKKTIVLLIHHSMTQKIWRKNGLAPEEVRKLIIDQYEILQKITQDPWKM